MCTLRLTMSHPLEYHNFVMLEVKKAKAKILDIGIGFGIFGYLTHVLRKPSLLVGIDICLDYLLAAKEHKIYDCLILASASSLPFRDKAFDYILAIEVLEHLPKVQGEKCLTDLEHICRGKIILTTPNGYLEQHPNNAPKSEIHLSGWSSDELKRRGYKVRGIGLKGTSKFRKRGARIYIYGLMHYLFTSITFFFPYLSEYLLAVKEKMPLEDLDEN